MWSKKRCIKRQELPQKPFGVEEVMKIGTEIDDEHLSKRRR